MGKNKDLQKMLTEFEKEFGHIKEWEIDRNERLRAQSKDAAKTTVNNKVGLHNPKYKEIRKEWISNAGKIGGKIVGKQNVESGHLQSIASLGGKVAGKMCVENSHMKIMTKKSVEACIKPILQYDLEGNLIKEWGSAADAVRELGCSPAGITMVCKGQRKKHKGFIWKYKDE